MNHDFEDIMGEITGCLNTQALHYAATSLPGILLDQEDREISTIRVFSPLGRVEDYRIGYLPREWLPDIPRLLTATTLVLSGRSTARRLRVLRISEVRGALDPAWLLLTAPAK